MPKYSDGFGYNLNSAGYPANTQVRESIQEIILDIEEIAAARAAANLPALADGDILEAIKLPAQCLVMAVGISVKAGDESADAGLTAAVGDDADTAGHVLATVVDAPGSACGVGTAAVYGVGKYYADADALDVLLAGAVPTTGKIRVWAKVVDGAGFYEVSEIPSETP